MGARGWVVGAVLVAATAGCSGGGSDPAPAPPKQAAKDVVRSIDPAKAKELKLGTDLEVVAELPRTVGRQDVHFSGFTEDGKLFGSMSEPAPPSDLIPGPPSPYQSQAFIYDLATKDFTLLDESDRDQATGVFGMVGTTDDVVWIESTDGPEVSEFTVRSYDRADRTVTDLAAITDRSGQTVYGSDLVVHDGTAYFSTTVMGTSKHAEPAVHAVPVDGSRPIRVLVAGGDQIRLEGDSLTYEKHGTRLARNLETGSTGPAATSPHASDPGFCGAELAAAYETWCVGRPVADPTDLDDNIADPVLSIKEMGGSTAVLKDFPGTKDNWPLPGDIRPYGDWIGFTMSGGDWPAPQYLVDPGTGALRTLPTDCMLTEVSADGTLAFFSVVKGEGSPPMRVVRLPRS